MCPKRKRKINKIIIGCLTVLMSVAVVSTAWSAYSLAHSEMIGSQGLDNLASRNAQNSRARAPEPSTLALFGSGLLGMIISFVRRVYALAKRFIDIALSVIAMIVLSPLYLAAAILIKLTSKGPVIFKQIRVGRDGEPFEIFKFRTMNVDAEKETGAVWATENDPRLIPAGKFLRKTHIDEIPQFINVLRGEMSVVGPRPERPVFVEKFKKEIHHYEKRLTVKPGITGLAQVWHKYDETIEDVKKKITYDLLYIKKFCLWTDVQILLGRLGLFLRVKAPDNE